MTKKAIFIAATGQNVGKTTLCLGIIAGLAKRFGKVGFIKPIGQQHVEIFPGFRVDKDAVLFKQYFSLPHSYHDISPVIIPTGFTRSYLAGREGNAGQMRSRIRRGFTAVSEESDFTVVEGTGHIGVGSIVDLNNAAVASELGLDIVVIATGGLGSSYDELCLNIQMCKAHGVAIRGVILNRVRPEKYAMVMEYFPKALAKHNIPLLGCVPYSQLLSTRAIRDFESLFNSRVVSGRSYRFHYLRSTRLVAGSLDSYLAERVPNELIITPASREDIIDAVLERCPSLIDASGQLAVALLLTGRHPPTDALLKRIRSRDMPALYLPLCSYDAMRAITSHIVKTRSEDTTKIRRAIQLVEEHFNFDKLCQER